MKHTFSGSCLGGPLDGQSLEHHQNLYRIFEPPSYELLGEYWHREGQWGWHPSSKNTNDVKGGLSNFCLVGPKGFELQKRGSLSISYAISIELLITTCSSF